VRVDGPVPHELGVYRHVDPARGTRVDSLARLLREARTCVCPLRGADAGGPADAAVAGLEGAVLDPRVRGGQLVLVLRDRRAVRRVFAGMPDSVMVFRALPWPRVDSVRVPVAYEYRFYEELRKMTKEPVDG
jgi:hypothetical protein